MAQTYARVSGGKFTPIRFTDEHLLFGDTIAGILAVGDEIYPILEPLPNIGSPGSPEYRDPTAREIELAVTDKDSLVKELYNYELGQPMGIATLDSSGDLSAGQYPSVTDGAESNNVSKLFELLRNPLTTAEDIETWSNTDIGYSCWVSLSSIPEIFLESPIIDKIRKCPSVMISIRKNRDLATLIEPWDVYNFVPLPRANEIAAMTDAEFTTWIGAEQDAAGLVEFSHSPNAMLAIANNELKMQLIASSEWALSRLFESKTTIECLTDNRTAMRALFGSQLAVNKINDAGYLFAKIGQHPESYDELAKSPIAMEGLHSNWNLFTIVSKIAAFKSTVLLNEECVGWFLRQPNTIALIANTTAWRDIIQTSDIAWNIYKDNTQSIQYIAANQYLAPKLISSQVRVDYLVSTRDLVLTWAGSTYALQAMFAKTEYRISIFEIGGKDAADILMRQNTTSKNYLAGLATSKRIYGGTQTTENRRVYFLMRYGGQLTSSERSIFGKFIGDYNTGDVTIYNYQTTTVEQRAKPLYLYTGSATSKYTEYKYVDMGAY